MKLIAHRGLVNGPNKHIENQPATINSALSNGFDCEIDLWVFDRRLYLGHDGPQYNITVEFLKQSGLWIHCKNLDALEYCGEDSTLNYFWHEEDTYTLTSQGFIWAYPDKILNKQSIMVLPEWKDPNFKNIGRPCFGICSDYVEKIKRIIPTAQT
jgi:hypothetical protein